MYITVVGFHISNTDINNNIIYLLAKTPQIKSIIIYKNGSTLPNIFREFQTINYNNQNQLNKIIFQNKIKIMYYLNPEKNMYDIPTIIPTLFNLKTNNFLNEIVSCLDSKKPYKLVYQNNNNKISLTFNSNNKKDSSVINLNDIKKEKYTVKLCCNWQENLWNDWSKMFPVNKKFKTIPKIEITTTNNPDIFVVVNKPLKNECIVPSRTIVFRMEPYIESNPWFNDWLDNIEGRTNSFMYFLEHKDFRNNSEWWLSRDVNQLLNDKIEKNKENRLSTVLSSQYFMDGHKLRIDFVKYFQQNSKYEIDVFGLSNDHGFRNYKGSLPLRQKDDAIFPYKYTFIAENTDIDNYFTEKIIDLILGESLCFYWGCSNVSDFIDSNAFIRLDLNNKEESLRIIEKSIENNEWEKRIDIIRKEKLKIINHYNFYTRISSLILIKNNMDFIYISERGDTKIKEIPGVKFNTVVLKEDINNLKNHVEMWNNYNNNMLYVTTKYPGNHFLDNLTVIMSKIDDIEGDWDIIFIEREKDDGSFKEISECDFKDIFSTYIINRETINKINSLDIFDISFLKCFRVSQ